MSCEACEQISRTGLDLRRLGAELARITAAFEPLAREYRRLQASHPRCASCLILVGPEHHEQQLRPEPMRPRAKGQKRYEVCAACYQRLYIAKRSVPEQRAFEREEAARLAAEEKEESNG